MVALLMVLGCTEQPLDVNPGEFALEDVNATSPRFGETVSPDDYTGQVSAWYFGHAT